MSAIWVRFLVALAAVQVAALTACRSDRAERAVIERWLLCEECTSGELEAVVALGDRATDRLQEALRTGPSQSDRDRIRHHAASRYAKLRTRLVTQVRWINHYDSSFVNALQAHAATALGRIGTVRARDALLEAMQRDTVYWPEVRRALALAAPSCSRRNRAKGRARPPDSFVRVTPAIVVTDSVSGLPLANVRGGLSSRFRQRTGDGFGSAHRLSRARLRQVGARTGTGLFQCAACLGVPSQPPVPRDRSRADASSGLPRAAHQRHARTADHAGGPRRRAGRLGPTRHDPLSGTVEAVIVPSGLTVTGPADSGRVDLPPIVPVASGSGFRIVARLTGATEAVSVTIRCRALGPARV